MSVSTDDLGAVRYGGFWVRLVAYIIDVLIVSLASLVLVPFGFDHLSEELTPLHLVQFAASFLYFWLMPATKYQGTFGKWIMGLKIVGPDGERISVLRALGRLLGEMVSAIILFIGYIMIAVHPRKRGLHDIIANTYVVER